MVKRHDKGPDGKYHVGGKTFDILEGSRAQVWHGTAYKTPGGLKKDDLVMNKHGRIVSKKKQATARREKRLLKAGYTAKKGKFGAVRVGEGSGSRSRSRSRSKSPKRRKSSRRKTARRRRR